MDKYAIRRKRLLQLIENKCGGVKAKLASDMNWQPSDVSRFFTKGKNGRRIHEDKAREMEQRYDLKKYWLDLDESEGSATNEPPTIREDLPPEIKRIVIKMKGLDPEALPDLEKYADFLAYRERVAPRVRVGKRKQSEAA